MKKKIGNFFDIRLFGYFYLYAMTPSSILDHPLKSIFSMCSDDLEQEKIYFFFGTKKILDLENFLIFFF